MGRQFFYKLYWKLQSFMVPTLKYSQTLYEEVLNSHCSGRQVWLDLGCGHQLLPPWRFEQEKELVKKSKHIVGIDYDFLSLTKHSTIDHKVRGSITQLPFADGTFDLITTNMVFEHLDCPEKQLQEICRVLKTGGKLIFHTPNKIGYSTLLARMTPEFIKDRMVYLLDGRKEEDVFPTYYRINSPAKIADLAESTGFRVSQVKMICSSAQFVILPPLVFLELLWIRFLMTKTGKSLRTNIIAVLEKV